MRVRLWVADPRGSATYDMPPARGDPTAANDGAGIARNEVTSAATTGPRARSTAATPRTTVLATFRRRSVASAAATDRSQASATAVAPGGRATSNAIVPSMRIRPPSGSP